MSAPAPRHLRARSRRLSTPLRWLLSLALLTPLVAGLAGVTGVARTPEAAAAPGSSAAVAVRFALAQLGKPYRWGADGPKSFDCSGLVQTSYRAAGIHLPRVSRQQYGAGKLVSLKHLRAGDLLFYAKDTSDRRTIYHVGMYLGAGRMVEAPNRRAPGRGAPLLRPGVLGQAAPPAARGGGGAAPNPPRRARRGRVRAQAPPRPNRLSAPARHHPRRRRRPRHLGQAGRQRPPAQPGQVLATTPATAQAPSSAGGGPPTWIRDCVIVRRMQERTGGQLVVDHLVANRIEAAFCVPGESYLAVLDALYDTPTRLITCRHEAGAANMAVAYGKLTGRPGVCLVTRGPGATQASVGVHTAAQDSAPLLLLVGQVGRGVRGGESFQELDVPAVFGPMAKWAAEADDPARLPELLARAFEVAISGRPGPVVLALPEDVLAATARVADASPVRPVAPGVAPADLARLRELLGGARRPLLIAGGPGWTEAAAADLRAVAEASRLPVAVSWRSQDVLDNRSGSYVGDLGVSANPALAERVRAADLVVAVGPRLGEITTGGYRLLEPPVPRQRLRPLPPRPAPLGPPFQPTPGANAGRWP